MLFETARLLLVGALLVVLPGYLLVQALFPPHRSTLSRLERAYLSLAGGLVLVTLVGLVLGFLPHGTGWEDRGQFQTLASGAPNAELALLVVSSLLLYVGIARGSFPRLARRIPHLSQATTE